MIGQFFYTLLYRTKPQYYLNNANLKILGEFHENYKYIFFIYIERKLTIKKRKKTMSLFFFVYKESWIDVLNKENGKTFVFLSTIIIRGNG